MSNDKPALNICQSQVKPGQEAEMERLLALHWPALHAAGLVTDEPSVVYRGLPSGKPGDKHGSEGKYIEIIIWNSAQGPQVAHETPGVMAVWEPMGAICEKMDFPQYEVLELNK